LEYFECFTLLETVITALLRNFLRPITPETLDRALGLLGKFFAARDHPPRHFVVCGGSSMLVPGLVTRTTTQDVLDLKPTASELLDAGKWTRTQDPSDGFRLLLGEMLKHLGHADLVAEV
jgi:hypothetical protein